MNKQIDSKDGKEFIIKERAVLSLNVQNIWQQHQYMILISFKNVIN